MMRNTILVTLALALAIRGWPQFGRRPSGGRQRGPSTQQRAPETPLATFHGTIESIYSKRLIVNSEEGNALEFDCSKTHYFDGSRKIKASDLKAGDHISLEAKRTLDGKLAAVNVRLEPPAKPE